MAFRTAVAVLAMAFCSAAAAQPAKQGPRFDPKEIAQHNKKVQECLTGISKQSVEEAQERLDKAAQEFLRWLAGLGAEGDEKRIQSVWRNIASAQARIDKVRGSPRKRKEFEPFVGTWKAEGLEGGTHYSVQLIVSDIGRVQCSAQHDCAIWVYKIDIALDEHRRGICKTEYAEDGFNSVSVAPQFFQVDSPKRTLESSHSSFTVSEDGSQITANLKIRVPGRTDRKEYDWSHALRRASAEGR